jgi:hypothetical protein
MRKSKAVLGGSQTKSTVRLLGVGLLTGRSKILAELSLKMISLASSRSAWLLGVQAGPCGDTASSKEPGPLRCRGHQHSSATVLMAWCARDAYRARERGAAARPRLGRVYRR